jgi:hypothetical protein
VAVFKLAHRADTADDVRASTRHDDTVYWRMELAQGIMDG